MKEIEKLRSHAALWRWTSTLLALACFSLLSIAIDFHRSVYLAQGRTYWWESLHLGSVGREFSVLTARHVSVHIPGILVDPIRGWQWIHLAITMFVTAACFGSIWLLGTFLIQRLALRGATRIPTDAA